MNGLENGSAKGSLFEIDKVQLMFSLNNIVSMVVASNVLCLALKTGRIIRIDLEHPEAVDDIDLPKKTSETGQIKHIFLDPTGTHLIITTSMGDNYYLNSSTTKPKALIKLKGLNITSVGWCPNHPSRVTGDILIGTSDGTIQETMIEPSNEYFKREERYLRQLWKNPSSEAITGLTAFNGSSVSATGTESGNIRKIIACSRGKIWYWQGKVPRRNEREMIPVYPKFFERETPKLEEFDPNEYEALAVSPYKKKETPKSFGWITGIGMMHGSMRLPDNIDKDSIFSQAELLLYDQLEDHLDHNEPVKSLLLTEYHILILQGKKTILAVNRLNNQVAFKQNIQVDSESEKIIGLCVDMRESTYWAYSEENIYEIRVVGTEDQGIWRTLLECGEYEEAVKLAKDAYSRDVVYSTYGEELLKRSEYKHAAALLGQCSKPFESCALTFMENSQFDALYIYLTTKLKNLNKSSKMQRTIMTSWVIELLMEKLNGLDDQIAAAVNEDDKTESQDQLHQVTKLYLKFIGDYKSDLDKDTVYEIISMHSRQEELLQYASLVDDGGFVLSYWIRMEQWDKALQVLRAENSPDLTYKYSTVLLVNEPKATVDTWMRISDLDPTKLIPALLSYVSSHKGSSENQAIRYLKFAIHNQKVDDPAVHNALVSIYASANVDESALLSFLRENSKPKYDYDFALRICTQFNRTQCSVYIYSAMGLYDEAVKLALRKDDIELAATVADRPSSDPTMRKMLWLEVGRKVIAKDGFEAGLELMNRCELLSIEDLLPLVPEFTVLDNQLKEQVINSMESYNEQIGQLNREMEDSVHTAASVKDQVSKFQKRYALIEPGEACAICEFPLATRRFYVFPCQHAFHSDCLLDSIRKTADYKVRQRISEATISGSKELPKSIDQILSEKCILCGVGKIESIDMPLVTGQMESFSL